MPSHIKLLISIMVLIIGGFVFYLDANNAAMEGHIKWIVLLLAVIMVGSIWVFPEASKKEATDIRNKSSGVKSSPDN